MPALHPSIRWRRERRDLDGERGLRGVHHHEVRLALAAADDVPSGIGLGEAPGRGPPPKRHAHAVRVEAGRAQLEVGPRVVKVAHPGGPGLELAGGPSRSGHGPGDLGGARRPDVPAIDESIARLANRAGKDAGGRHYGKHAHAFLIKTDHHVVVVGQVARRAP